MNVLLAFVITMAILLISLIVFKVSAGVALFVCAVLMGILCGMPLTETTGYLTSGFGSIMTSIGLLILFGGIFGMMLGDSGGMEEMAKGLLRVFGKKNDMLALNLAGFIVSIPVYFGSAYITLNPLVGSLQKLTKKKTSAYVAALFTGLLLTHCVVAPTPGPLAVAGQIGDGGHADDGVHRGTHGAGHGNLPGHGGSGHLRGNRRTDAPHGRSFLDSHQIQQHHGKRRVCGDHPSHNTCQPGGFCGSSNIKHVFGGTARNVLKFA